MNIPSHYLNSITTGDARTLACAIPDNSISLIFTDPVYDRIADYEYLAILAKRVLKPGGAYLAFGGIAHCEQTIHALRQGGMAHRWIFAVYTPGASSRIEPNIFCNWQILFYGGGLPLITTTDSTMSTSMQIGGEHAWRKNMLAVSKYIQAFSVPGDVVLDPFSGGGTVPAVCKMLARDYVAFEIDPATAERARLRVEQTQPPLPLVYHETATLPGFE